jgi:myo-inositol 2-dehydrogenase / D-chiro-inositol 1-dehydrogenase
MSFMNGTEDSSTRRNFMIGSALAAGFPALIKGAPASNAIKVGLVGCGGRGTGAAAQALKADDYSVLTAVADIYQDRVDACLTTLRKDRKDRADQKVMVDPAKQFIGLDAYEKLIASGVDVVLLATPPGFRPTHLRAAIEANKHVFCEKPIAVDAPGVRHVLETTKMAQEKNLSLVSGFCWRYANHILETFDRLHTGAIGDIVTYYATYYTSPVKPMPPASDRPAGMSDVEWQIKNWYNFCWLCGDSLVEQAVHSVDKVAWAMKDQPPISCVAVGGRQIPAEGGNIFDHFEVNYLYPNNSDYILGTKGTVTIGRGPVPKIEGQNPWTFTGKKNDMYQAEHDALFAAIRKNQPINNGQRMATSTMLAIMGRMAAYTGQQVTWDDAMNSQEHIFPAKLDWNMSMPVAPMPRPGVTKLA